MNPPEISIIIVNWNTRDLVSQCIRSIYANAPVEEIEVIVVDNGSNDQSVEHIRGEFPQVKIVENRENLGFSKATNIGIEQSHGRYVLLLNSDVFILEESISSLYHCAEMNPQAGIIGGKLLNPDLSFQASYNDFPNFWMEMISLFGISRFFHSGSFPSYPLEKSLEDRSCDWVGGACIMVRKTAIEDVGKLDECYFMYAEELDWCYRMKQKGWDVYYCSDAEVIHLGGGSASRKSGSQLIRLYKSKSRFLKLRYGSFPANLFGVFVKISAILKIVAHCISSIFSKHPLFEFKSNVELLLGKTL